MGEMKRTSDSCILYGVPKVQFGMKSDGQKMEMPFPMVLKVVLNYLGQNIGYSQIMATTGLAFSQRWCVDRWNYADKPFEPFERGLKGAGRRFNISVNLENIKSITKDDAFALIKVEMDCGRPLIALGVVGPPEPCIVTGYKNNGKTLLGHSLFQQWDKGLAFDAWAKAVVDDVSWFCDEAGECHSDQEKMLHARGMAAVYIEQLAGQYAVVSEELMKCASLLKLTSECAVNLHKIRLGKMSNMDDHKEVRFVTSMHIRQAAQYEKEAVEILKGIVDKL